jgi:hypothetical protein
MSVKKTIAPNSVDLDYEFRVRVTRWEEAPSLLTAAELVETAIIAGREIEAIDPARRIINVDFDAAPMVRRQAAELLIRQGFSSSVPEELKPLPKVGSRQSEARNTFNGGCSSVSAEQSPRIEVRFQIVLA